MNWLPEPTDFRGQLKAALDMPDLEARFEALCRLAQFRLGYLETIQLDNAIAGATRDFQPLLPGMRLALLASSTVDHLPPGIRVAGLRRGLLLDVYVAAYGQSQQLLLSTGSALYEFRPDIVLLSSACEAVLPAIPLAASGAAVAGAIDAAVAEIRELWRVAHETLQSSVIQQTVLDQTAPLFGSYDRLVPAAPPRVVAVLNEALVRAAGDDGVLLLDVAGASARDGIDAWFDVTRWLQGKLEIAPQAAPYYGELVARLIGAQRGQSRKCLVLDLDNTLWGGVIGDDGVEGIVLGQGSAAGEAYLALQRYALRLRERGIMLAACSKNELATAEQAFAEHPEMALSRSDFAAFVANWDDKARNLEIVAQQLNIGLDSLVFIDDNPAERARIRQSLPMVAVPELPRDPANYVRCIADAGYFEAVGFTEDDRRRAGQYAANTERDALRATVESIDDYLSSLDMAVTFGPVTPVNLARAAQLINKTNQFNTTAQRCAAEELARVADAKDNVVLQFRLTDRFGDNGLVSVIMLCPEPGDPDALRIVNWVMSCRVFGRQLEDQIMNIVVEKAAARGFGKLFADYMPSGRNSVVGELYRKLGFAPRHPATDRANASGWELGLAGYAERQTFIRRRPETT